MADNLQQRIMQHLSNPQALQSFLTEVRRGLALRPSDNDILQALESLPPAAALDAIRATAQEHAQRRIHRRRVVAQRQQRRLMAKLRDFW